MSLMGGKTAKGTAEHDELIELLIKSKEFPPPPSFQTYGITELNVSVRVNPESGGKGKTGG